MKKLSYLSSILLISFCCYCYTGQTYASSIAFDQEQFSLMKKQNKGKQWLMLLWSVDCPACFKELAVIQQLQHQQDNLAVVIINTDANNETTQERIEIIEKFGLSHVSNFHFLDGKSEQSRYIIDSNWYGELPRSYFVESNGNFHGKSGLIKPAIIAQWLLN